MSRGLVTVCLAVVALVVAAGVAAREAAFGVAATKACFTKKGAQFQAPVPGSPRPGLSAGQQGEALVGTIPAGSTPAFLYLAIGRDAADALAVRKALETKIVPNPTVANSWSDAKDNAAWIVVSLTGSPPAAAVRSLVLSCLKVGPAPTGSPPSSPTRYVRATVVLCMEANGLGGAVEPKLLQAISKPAFGVAIPAPVLPHVLLVYTATSPGGGRRDGPGIFILFGKTQADALTLRTQLDAALHLSRAAGSWQGAKRNIAWLAFSRRSTTAAGVSAGKRLLLSCLS